MKPFSFLSRSSANRVCSSISPVFPVVQHRSRQRKETNSLLCVLVRRDSENPAGYESNSAFPSLYTRCATPQQRLLAALLELLLQHSLDNLLLLDQESANDAVLHAVRAAGAAVSAGDGLLALLSDLRLNAGQVLQLLLLL